jgi:hypothetical protein
MMGRMESEGVYLPPSPPTKTQWISTPTCGDIHALNSGGRSDKCRHSFFTGLVGNKGAFVAVQEEGQQLAPSSDVMTTTSVRV